MGNTSLRLSEVLSRLACLARTNNECADQIAPMQGCFSHPTTWSFLVMKVHFSFGCSVFMNTFQTLPDIRSGAVMNFTRPNKNFTGPKKNLNKLND